MASYPGHASVSLNIYDDRMSIASPGAMPKNGRLPESVLDTDIESTRRNPVLADLFQRMSFMERHSSGLRKICPETMAKDNYEDKYLPRFENSNGFFRVTLPQPFDGNNMLTNFEVRFDDLNTESLWLQAHFYDIRPEYRQDAKPESTPVARRMRGWRFLLVDKSEMGHVGRIVVNNESVAWRQGESLINGIRFNAAMLACYTDETAASNNRKAIVLHDYLANADPLLAADEDELCSRFGYTRDAYEQALLAEGCQLQTEAYSGQTNPQEMEEASSGWLDGLKADEEG